MGRPFHLLESNRIINSSMARKFFAHKKHIEGFEAPRNSLEMQLEAYQSTGDFIVDQDWSQKDCYPFDVPMKTLIDEEIPKQSNNRKSSPSIVARLMGVDMLPIDPKTATKHPKRDSNSFESFDLYKERDDERCENGENFGRSRPREHPQEEELQKFKKEFEAWQAARFKECSKVVEKENIDIGKVVREAISGKLTSEKSVLKEKELISSRNSSISRNHEAFSVYYDPKFDESFAPKRIVILKPGPDRICDPDEDSWPISSCATDERGSIEDFLQEVKERLNYELQGKTWKTSSGVRGSGIETPFSEKPSKQIARHIAKHVRDSVARNLVRSESTRSYGGEIQIDGPDSPEFINRNTRKFLTERLRNVLKREKHPPDVQETHEMHSRSFRKGDGDVAVNRELSPRNLVRSLSAPVSGTSFGKLLLEDRHVLTGAHIRRKHENVKMDLGKAKKERFNIREKVSNFRSNLSLRGKLLGKKLQSMVESHGCEQDFVNDIVGGPTVVRNFSERHVMENSTEVPPSPVSVCSSAQEDFWRPVDNPTVTPADDSTTPQVFKEISSNLNELRRQLNELESDEPDSSKTEEETDDFTMVNIDDKVQVYVRDLLVASGLYSGSFDQWLSRWDPLAKPISKSVFEKLEEKHSKSLPDDSKTEHETTDRKLVYDLLNETVAVLIGPPVTISRFRRKIIRSSPLRGRKLLESVWEMMKVYLNPPLDKSCDSLDSMVAKSLETSHWSGLIENEINGLTKDIETEIIGDLVHEIAAGFVYKSRTLKHN